MIFEIKSKVQDKTLVLFTLVLQTVYDSHTCLHYELDVTPSLSDLVRFIHYALNEKPINLEDLADDCEEIENMYYTLPKEHNTYFSSIEEAKLHVEEIVKIIRNKLVIFSQKYNLILEQL